MPASASKKRWVIVFSSFIVMMIISIYQYSWFLFAYAIEQQLHWNLATIGLTFTVFAYAATFIQPFSGFIADSYGPGKVSVTAAALVGLVSFWPRSQLLQECSTFITAWAAWAWGSFPAHSLSI